MPKKKKTQLSVEDSVKALKKWVKEQVEQGNIPPPEDKRPLIVCLCGSTRFFEAFQKANYDETLAGHIVLSIGCDTKSDAGLGITEDQKKMLDELHKRKIDLADEVLVLNVGGYIGSSTRGEIEYARAHDKPIRWLEPNSIPEGSDY